MIMQGRTPRSLSWTGWCAVFGTGLFLLPLLPARAQLSPDTPPGARSADDADQRIEDLKKELKALEDKKRAEKAASADAKKENAAVIAKARAEAEALGKQAEAKRRELREIEQRYHQALARLAKLSGKSVPHAWVTPDGNNFKYYITDGQSIYDAGTGQNWYYKPENVTPYQVSPNQIWHYFGSQPKANSTPDGKSKTENANKRYQAFEWTYANPGAQAKPGAGDRTADLEKKLERLFKEVEELRRELRKNGSASGQDEPKQP
jgi:hypothetical protein